MLSKGLLCAVSAAAVAAAAAPPAFAAFPGHNGRIAFISDRDGDFDIYTMRPDGQDVRNLTPGTDDDGEPAWSADGRRIAWSSNHVSATNPTGDYELFVMNADGSGKRQVTFNTSDEDLPGWSPDGSRLVFTRLYGSFLDADVLTIRLDGTGERNLTNSPGIADREASWSPDGRTIAFSGNRDGQEFFDIYTMRPDGSDARRITFTQADEQYPDWLPDGSRIAFNSSRDDVLGQGLFEIYTVRPDGSRPIRVTHSDSGEHGFALPAWSPDGRQLAAVSGRSGDEEVWTLQADGGALRNRTQSPQSTEVFPDWQPLHAR